jgi:hypothetical protein
MEALYLDTIKQRLLIELEHMLAQQQTNDPSHLKVVHRSQSWSEKVATTNQLVQQAHQLLQQLILNEYKDRLNYPFVMVSQLLESTINDFIIKHMDD